MHMQLDSKSDINQLLCLEYLEEYKYIVPFAQRTNKNLQKMLTTYNL